MTNIDTQKLIIRSRYVLADASLCKTNVGTFNERLIMFDWQSSNT
jgi:hypothetical protein